MNERIKLLAEQATRNVESSNSYHSMVFDKEKFTELLIQDNIRTLRGNGYDDAAQCLQDIHFGIEDPV